jgi:haloalkane dehalogenase
MIPPLVAAGHRVIAPDLVGFGRSDKPVNRADHTYERHVDWMRTLLFDRLDLRNVTVFAQDWGGLIGLRLVAEHPDRFDRVAIANTGLPTGDEAPNEAFLNWRESSQAMPIFPTGQILQRGTVGPLTDEAIAAYDAPFPDSTYQAGPREMPVLVPIGPDDPASAANRAAWEELRSWSKPLVTWFSDRDPVTAPWARPFRTEVPGAQDQAHQTIAGAGHFLQEDKGEELAQLILRFIAETGN